MKTIPHLREIAVKHLQEGRKGGRVTKRVDVEHIEQLCYRVSVKGGSTHEFVVDEPEPRGGTDRGAAPLDYFLGGAITCLLNQFIKVALAKNAPIDGVKGSARGHLEFAIDGGFEDIIFRIDVEGEISVEALKELVAEAERYCFVHCTLKRAIPVTTEVYLNKAKAFETHTSPNE